MINFLEKVREEKEIIQFNHGEITNISNTISFDNKTIDLIYWLNIYIKFNSILLQNFIKKTSSFVSKRFNRLNMKNIVSFVRLPTSFTIIFIVVNILSIANASEPLRNPYEILGITRHATIQEIRKAYKNLVKEWHPDKTNHPAAENKFVEITKAYELLADPERRKKFDNHGITEENMSRQKQSSYFHMTDPIDELFNGGNFKFHYQSRDVSFFHKMSISYRTYENTIVPRSYRTPYLILFYYDWCFTCIQIESTWRRLIDKLEPIGVKLVTAHAERETSFARKVGVHSLPCLAITLDGRTSIYKDSLFNVNNTIEFLRNKFPYKLILKMNENNIDQFLSGWVDNRIRALIFEDRDSPRLRYLLLAFHHRERVAFGFVQMGNPETEAIVMKYKIPKDLNTLLLFNENSEKPMASVSMKDISSETMHNVITNNNFLTLPRLSNQAMLDSVCPPEWLKPQKRLCAILVSQNSAVHDLARHKFRQAAIESPYSTERVRYTYIFKESQPEFVAALSASEGSPMEPLLHIVIIWRRDINHLKYEWLKTKWIEPTQDENKWNESRQSLEQTIQRLLRTTEALPYAAKIEELADEHAKGTVDKIIGRALLAIDYISDNISKKHVLFIISVITTLILIAAATYGLSYLVKLEEMSIQMNRGDYENNFKSMQVPSQLRLHELRAEKYNGLVRLLKPGCRTIILLVDHQSRLKLIPTFHEALWPYRKNKTLMFSYMNMERGLNWYKKLLSLSLPELKELKINPKNCVGTVLALNGHRKYFCIYHAKHPECNKDKESKRMERITKQMSQRSEDAEAGAFISFDNSSDSEMSQDEIANGVIEQDRLLAGLPNWLDRLFEGSTQRYHVNYWPDFTAK